MRASRGWLRGVLASALLVALAGCQGNYLMTADQEDFMSFDHPFTDQAAAQVRSRADRTCEARKLVAVRLSSNCSLTKCFTTYQCMEKDAAASYGPPSGPAALPR
jgi:hypothetical protein